MIAAIYEEVEYNVFIHEQIFLSEDTLIEHHLIVTLDEILHAVKNLSFDTFLLEAVDFVVLAFELTLILKARGLATA